MFRKMISATRNWIGGSSPLEDLSEWEVRRQRDRIKRERERHKEEMVDLRETFEQKLANAESATAHEIEELKVEASYIIERYKQLRYERNAMLQIERWLTQVMLGMKAGTNIPDILETLEIDEAQVPAIADEMRERRQQDHEAIMERGWEASQMGDAISDGNREIASDISDDKVEEAFDAIQSGEEMPSLDSLIEQEESQSTSDEPLDEMVDEEFL